MVNKHMKKCSKLLIIQFSSATQSCLILCDPKNCSTPGLPVHHQHPEFTQTHVHGVSDAIQPSHPLSSLSPPAPNPSQNQSLFQWVNSSHEVAKVLEFQLYGCESWTVKKAERQRVGLWRRQSAKELMLLNCGVGEDSWESLGLQRDPTSPFWRRSALGFLWKEWC